MYIRYENTILIGGSVLKQISCKAMKEKNVTEDEWEPCVMEM